MIYLQYVVPAKPTTYLCVGFQLPDLGGKHHMISVITTSLLNIGIKHGFSCINIRQVPWEVLKTEAEGRGFQHLPRDLSNVNALKNHVRSLLLHKIWKHWLLFALFLALFCFVFSPMSRERYLHGLCPFWGRAVHRYEHIESCVAVY